MAKSVAVGATLGSPQVLLLDLPVRMMVSFKISLGSTDTRNLKEGRYVYNVLVSSGSTIYSIANGNVLVIAGISSLP